MDEILKRCHYYHDAPRVYEKYFQFVYDYIFANPYSRQIDLINHCQASNIEWQKSIGRIAHDVRRLINEDAHKVHPESAPTEIVELEDGDTSKLAWVDLHHKKLLVLSDIHFPYHDKTALMLALRDGRQNEVDGILLNGDILDCYQLSKFAKDSRKPSIRAEMDVFRFFIDQLKQRFPNAEIYYKLGNHEVRLERWIQQNAQMFDGMFDLENLINFRDSGVVYLKDNIGVKMGKLHIIHGHEIRASMGVVNIARTYYMKAQTNLLFGHWHQQQEYISRTMDGHNVGAWAQGCLCKLDAEYTYGINQWVHGFSIVELLNDAGDFRVKLKKIIGGEIV